MVSSYERSPYLATCLWEVSELSELTDSLSADGSRAREATLLGLELTDWFRATFTWRCFHVAEIWDARVCRAPVYERC